MKLMLEGKEVATQRELASRLGVADSRIRHLVITRGIPKSGRYIPVAPVLKAWANRRPVGRPRRMAEAGGAVTGLLTVAALAVMAFTAAVSYCAQTAVSTGVTRAQQIEQVRLALK